MGLINKPDSILTALDSYFLSELDSSLQILHRISKLFNETTEPSTKIQQKFNLYFSYTSNSRIRKYLDLLEYLSIFSSAKLPDIINTEVFVEAFANVIMEPEFQDDILNLLKIWFDRYDSSKGQVNRIFEFIENLQNFGMFLPTSYKSKYEGIDADALMSVMTDKKEPGYQQIPQHHGMDLENGETLMTQAQKIRGKAHSLLSDPDFDTMPKPYMISTVRILIEELQDVIVRVKTSNVADVKGMENDLEHYCNELKKKIEYKPSQKVYTSTDEDYAMMGSEPDPENNYDGTVFTQMMELDEFLSYKTEPCKDEMRCKYAPTTRKGFQLGALKKEMHCKDWHGMQDRRRPVFDSNGNMLYNATECKAKDECMSSENCRKTHNMFEFLYHPKNYKSKKCTGVCKNGKYCPYFHSKEENEAWSNLKQVYLNLKDDDNEIAEDDDESGDEMGKTSNKAYENARRHMPPNVLSEIRKTRVHYGPHEQPKTLSEKRGYETKIEVHDVPDGKPKDKELNSKLVIRKEYLDPKGITTLLRNSPCFYGVPIFVHENSVVNGVHEIVKKQNDDEI